MCRALRLCIWQISDKEPGEEELSERVREVPAVREAGGEAGAEWKADASNGEAVQTRGAEDNTTGIIRLEISRRIRLIKSSGRNPQMQRRNWWPMVQ